MLSLKRLELKWFWPEFILPNVSTPSTIEYLTASDGWTVKQLIQFLKYLPKLKRLITNIKEEKDGSDGEFEHILIVSRMLVYHLELRGSYYSSLYTIKCLFQCFSQLVVFWSGCTQNITVMHSSEWERLISKYLPLLVKLYLHITLYGDSASSLVVEDVLPKTDFWIKRKWSLEYIKFDDQVYCIVKPYKTI
ncbi:unnamed protein product [Didymodactylos carnosus]|nr:unnamed protein product [Didymodactylos carnosus]CAF4417452.1 unnamed protein product [Didymodactylos carnosus]